MPLETDVNGIPDLNPSWPLGTDFKNEGDDHIRNIKKALLGTFPDMNDTFPNTFNTGLSTFGANLLNAKITSLADADDPTDAANLRTVLDRIAALTPDYVISAGAVDLDGSIADAGSGDWSCVRQALGRYVLTFDKFNNQVDQPIITAVNGTDPGATITGFGISVSQCQVETETAAGANADAKFSFIRLIIPTN